MNVFDSGGIISIIAIILTLIVGAGLFMLVNSIFDITYGGFGKIGGLLFSCCCIAAFIVNIAFSLLGGIFAVVWFLIKWAVMIGGAGFAIYFIYGKIKGTQNNQSEK